MKMENDMRRESAAQSFFHHGYGKDEFKIDDSFDFRLHFMQ